MRKIFDQVLVYSISTLMIIMVSATLLQVFARMTKLNVPFTEELTIYSMIWVTMLGSAYTFGLKKHIAIDILSSYVKPANKYKLEIIVELIIAFFAILILIIGGLYFTYMTFKLGQVSSIMQISKGWIYIILPISGILTLAYNYFNIKDLINSSYI